MIDGSIISLDSDETRKFREMVKDKYVATNHKRKISYVESRGIWRTFVGNPRKEVTRKTKELVKEFDDRIVLSSNDLYKIFGLENGADIEKLSIDIYSVYVRCCSLLVVDHVEMNRYL